MSAAADDEPLADGAGGQREPDHLGRPRPRLVLLVEPDEDTRIVCVTILRHFGDRTMETATAAEALAAARAASGDQRPDRVLLGPSLSPADLQAVRAAFASDPVTRDLVVELFPARATDASSAG